MKIKASLVVINIKAKLELLQKSFVIKDYSAGFPTLLLGVAILRHLSRQNAPDQRLNLF